MLIVPGLHAADLTRSGRAYLVEGPMECVLIDTGAPDGSLGVGHLIEQSKRRPHEVRMILLTHAHAGHAGNAAALRVVTGARLAASEETARLLRSPGEATGVARGLVGLARRPPPWPTEPVRIDDVLQPGQVLDLAGGIEVVAAPGHAPGSLAFHCYGPNALMVGDAARIARTGALVAPPSRTCADATQARATADHLAAIAAHVVAPGHGLPSVDGRLPSRRFHGG